jgi:hypothetical protein
MGANNSLSGACRYPVTACQKDAMGRAFAQEETRLNVVRLVGEHIAPALSQPRLA